MRNLRRLVVLLPVLAIACGDESVETAAGEVTVDPATVDFGGVFLGQRSQVEVEFRNSGAATARVRLAEKPNALFSAAMKDDGFTIPGGGTRKVTFAFTPEVAQAEEGLFVFSVSNAKNRRIELPVKGVGLSTLVRAEPLDFGSVPVGSTATRPLTLTSESDGTLDLQLWMSVQEGETNPFSISTDSLILEPRGTGTVDVTFSPATPGSRSARLMVRPCAECAPLSVEVRGTGEIPQLVVTPQLVDFEYVTHGVVASRVIRVQNRGSLPIRVSRAAFENAAAPDMSVPNLDSLFPADLAAGETREIEVIFAPNAEEPTWTQQVATLTFFDGDDVPAAMATVMGTPGGPNLKANPAVVDFGIQPVGRHPVSMIVTVRNEGQPGSVDLYRPRIDVEPGAKEIFSVERVVYDENDRVWIRDDDTYPVDAGLQAINFRVTFDPSAAGEHYATMVFPLEGDDQTELQVPIAGVAREVVPCDLEIRPPEIRFGLVPNDSEARRRVDVVNRGTDDCMIWNVRLDQAGSHFFTLLGSHEQVITLAPGAALPLTVRYAPTGFPDQRHTTRILFDHSLDGTSTAIPVSGWASRFNLRVSPDPVVFEDGPAGQIRYRNVRLVNAGSHIPRITSVRVQPDADGTPSRFTVDPFAGEVSTTVDIGGRYQARHNADVGFHTAVGEVLIEGQEEPLFFSLQTMTTDEDCDERCALPVAVCPAPVITNVNNQVMLSGQGIHPAGRPTTCQWTMLTAPIGSRTEPDAAAQCETTFTPDIVGEYTLQLAVTDDINQTSVCVASVRANPFGGLWVETFWSPAGDIDLHLAHEAAGDPAVYGTWVDDDYTCFYRNCQPHHSPLEWDAPGPNDNPSLDRDDVTGSGPENTRINQPSTEHRYYVGFRNFSNSHSPTVTFNVYCSGALVHSANYRTTRTQEIFYVGDVQYHGSTACSFNDVGLIIPPPF